MHKMLKTMQKRTKLHWMWQLQKMDTPNMLNPLTAAIHRALRRERFNQMGMSPMQSPTDNHTNTAITECYGQNSNQQKTNHSKAETSKRANYTDTSSDCHLNESGEAGKTEIPSEPLNTGTPSGRTKDTTRHPVSTHGAHTPAPHRDCNIFWCRDCCAMLCWKYALTLWKHVIMSWAINYKISNYVTEPTLNYNNN